MTSRKFSYSLKALAEHAGATVVGDEDYQISGLNTLQNATSEQLSFLANALYQKDLATTAAGCVILHPNEAAGYHGNKLVAEDPYYAFALLTQLFVDDHDAASGIHPTVVLGEDTIIAEDASIAANVVIGRSVSIESGARIGAGCYIGDHSHIAKDTVIYPNVSIYSRVNIGAQCIVHSGAVIGSDGFGFAPKKNTSEKKAARSGAWQKIYQLGGVEIGDNVEIGAGTTIDRGALENTVIAQGVKLDNQIQIAHNVVIGENTAIAGATAIAGSTVIGQRCTIAGAVGIIGHLTITDDVHITAMTLVTKSIEKSGSYSSGTPLNKTAVWRKNAARFNRLDESLKRLMTKK